VKAKPPPFAQQNVIVKIEPSFIARLIRYQQSGDWTGQKGVASLGRNNVAG